MAITLKQLKEYVAEDVLCYFLCDYDYDFEDCVLADKNNDEVLLKSIIEKDKYPNYNLYTLFVDNPDGYEDDELSARDHLNWSVWEPFEYADDDELKLLMNDMFTRSVEIWTDRLKLGNK